MTVRVREAVPADAEGVARVHVESWRWAYRGMVPDDVLASLSWQERRDRWRERLAPGRDVAMRTWVALADPGAAPGGQEAVVGFASFGPSRDEGRGADVAELYAVYLAPAWSRRGAGTALVRAGAGALPERFTRLDVWVLADNATALAFYRRCGLDPDGGGRTLDIGGATVAEVRCSAPREVVERRVAP